MRNYRRRKALEALKKNVVVTMAVLLGGSFFVLCMMEVLRTSYPHLF